MKKLLLLGTGGTIACLPTKEGLAPEITAKELLGFIGYNDNDIDCKDLFKLDSSNIQPEEWGSLAKEIAKARGEYGAVIITHGTDTMAYTSSMLSFMLTGIDIPVVLTGSQFPMVYPGSDGRLNLTDSIIAARQLPGGVYVCFGGSVMLGCRAVKVRTTSLNAFESINAPCIGVVAGGRYIKLENTPTCKTTFKLCCKIETNVALIKLIPGVSPALFEALPNCNYKALVVEAFGLGGVHSIRRDHTKAIMELLKKDMPVVISSQCLYEKSTPDVYEVSSALKELGVISAVDMTTEAAVTKLMWVLGQTRDMVKIREKMHQSVCGEISV